MTKMHLTINNVQSACIKSTNKPGILCVDLHGVSVEDLLRQLDIQDIIEYFGTTELLDILGKETINEHLKSI